VACALVSDITNGKFNLLKWDKQERKYYPIEIDLLYATKKNFTGKQIYKKKDCYLHKAAIPFYEKSIELALKLNLKLNFYLLRH